MPPRVEYLFYGDRRRVPIRCKVPRIVLPNRYLAGLFEGGETTIRPVALPDSPRQQCQQLRVLEQSGEATITSLGEKGVGITVKETCRYRSDALLSKRIEVQDRRLLVTGRRDDLIQVATSEPVRASTGEPEVWVSQVPEPVDNGVDGLTGIEAAGTDFVESVDEQGLPGPFRVWFARIREPVRSNRRAGTWSGLEFRLESRCLPGPGIAQQYVRACRSELGQWERLA